MKPIRNIRTATLNKLIHSRELVLDERLTSIYRNVGGMEPNVYRGVSNEIIVEHPLIGGVVYTNEQALLDDVAEREKRWFTPILSPAELLNLPTFFTRITALNDELSTLVGFSLVATKAGYAAADAALIKLERRYRRKHQVDELFPLMVAYIGQVLVNETAGHWASLDSKGELPIIVGADGRTYDPGVWLYKHYAESRNPAGVYPISMSQLS